MSSRVKASLAQAANDIVIEAWRYARQLGRTPAERIAIYNAEIQPLMHASANVVWQYARKRRRAVTATPAAKGRGKRV